MKSRHYRHVAEYIWIRHQAGEHYATEIIFLRSANCDISAETGAVACSVNEPMTADDLGHIPLLCLGFFTQIYADLCKKAVSNYLKINYEANVRVPVHRKGTIKANDTKKCREI